MPLHPALVHLPLALALVVPLTAGGILLGWWKDALPRRAWWIAVGLQSLLVAGGLAAMQTGEADEERVEEAVGEAAIEAHEAAAQLFVWTAVGVLVLAAGGAGLRDETLARRAAAASVVGSAIVLALAIRTGDAGGRLVYEQGAAQVYATGAAGGEAAGSMGEGGEDEDDD